MPIAFGPRLKALPNKHDALKRALLATLAPGWLSGIRSVEEMIDALLIHKTVLSGLP